jgi:predicted transcriptional regulator
MQMIIDRSKTYEFRKGRYPTSVLRIWFYQTAPISSITYICEVDPGLARDPSNLLPLNGHRNKEFNEGIQPDWSGPMHAYRVKSCYKIRKPIPLGELKEKYGFGGAPRGMVYVTEKMRDNILWDKQELMWTEATEKTT